MDFDHMAHIASLCGMSEREFINTTPRYLGARYRAWSENQRPSWEQARLVAFWVVKTVDSKRRFKRLTDVIEFSWDQKRHFKKSAELTPEESAKFNEDADEALRLLNPEAYRKYMAGKTPPTQ